MQLSDSGWRMEHDKRLIVLLHKTGCFLEVLMRHQARRYSAQQIENLDSVVVSLFFEKKTRFEIGVGDNIIATDYANAGQVYKITVSSLARRTRTVTT